MYRANIHKNLIEDLFKLASKEVNKGYSNDFINEFKNAYLIRKVEQKFLELFSKSLLSGTVHTCIGQEMIGVAVSKYLNKEDWVTSNHRCHGHFISKTGKWRELIDELLGLNSGVSRGIGSSQHLFSDGFISNGTQGSLLPVGSGLAKSAKVQSNNRVVVSYIGEGTLGEGVLYESLNLSSKLELPHIFICENNFYSQSTPQGNTLSGSIENRAKAFGIDFAETSTWNLDDLFKKCKHAIEFSRNESKPFFLNIKTYRLAAHSKGDDDRDVKEVNDFKEIDPLNLFFINKNKDLISLIDNEVDNYSDMKILSKDYYDYNKYKKDQLPNFLNQEYESIKNQKKLLSVALRESYFDLLINSNAYFIGEDIADPYGGAFKIYKGFQEERPSQVVSTPISEAGLIGLSIGMSIEFKVVIAEIMFGDFIVNAMDQIINNASKFFHMYGKQFSCPLLIRTPMGGGRGYGPTHSQSLDKFLIGIDNLVVASTTSLIHPKKLIQELISLDSPKILIENKIDYTKYLFETPSGLNLQKFGGNLGTVILSPHDTEIDNYVITYGSTARMIADNYIEIFEESDVAFSLICPQILHPFPFSHLRSFNLSFKKIIVLDESTSGFSWSDGVASQIHQYYSNTKVITLNSDPVPIPSNKNLEKENLISKEKIIEGIIRLNND